VKKITAILLTSMILLQGCTSIQEAGPKAMWPFKPFPDCGPFVTDIAFDSDGNLVVTKNTIVYVEGGPISHVRNGKKQTTEIIKYKKIINK